MRLFFGALLIDSFNKHWGWYVAMFAVWGFTKLWVHVISPRFDRLWEEAKQLPDDPSISHPGAIPKMEPAYKGHVEIPYLNQHG